MTCAAPMDPVSRPRAHGASSTRRRLALALALAAAYMVAEIIGGILTGSLALLADAGHMLSDTAALALALFAAWVASRPADQRWTYGHARAEILAALAQGVALVAVALIIAFEALERLGAPQPVRGLGMLIVATGGLAVNVAALLILNPGRSQSLNVRGAWLHVLSDALGSVGAMGAGALIWLFGWNWADPVACLAICTLVLYSAWHLIREALDILMEAAPSGLDVGDIERSLSAVDGVRSVHDLHVWSVAHGQIALSCHLVVPRDGRSTPLLSEVYSMLGARFGIDHATIQVEPEDFADQTPRSVCGCGI
jgi:cobalt-zinc-cadmium efflux system protein